MLVGKKYNPELCSCCNQTVTYLLAVDRGTVDIVKAISVAIRKKGRNEIHPRKEMEVAKNQLSYEQMVIEGVLTSNQVGNLSRARMHGLIAAIDGNRGSYCLTRKGAKFLRGEAIPKYAIINKAIGHQVGYWEEYSERVTISSFRPDQEYWQVINYTIEDGRMVYDDVPQGKPKQISLFNFQKLPL